jgi:hypothetical protein
MRDSSALVGDARRVTDSDLEARRERRPRSSCRRSGHWRSPNCATIVVVAGLRADRRARAPRPRARVMPRLPVDRSRLARRSRASRERHR